MKKTDSYIGLTFEGLIASIGANDKEILTYRKWDQIIADEIRIRSLVNTQDSPIIVSPDYDSITELNDLIDSLREAADKFEQAVKSKKILMSDGKEDVITYQQYMRGEY